MPNISCVGLSFIFLFFFSLCILDGIRNTTMTFQADLDQYKTDYMKLSVSVSALERLRYNQTNTQSGMGLQTNVLVVVEINYYSEMHGVSLNPFNVFMKCFVSKHFWFLMFLVSSYKAARSRYIYNCTIYCYYCLK